MKNLKNKKRPEHSKTIWQNIRKNRKIKKNKFQNPSVHSVLNQLRLLYFLYHTLRLFSRQSLSFVFRVAWRWKATLQGLSWFAAMKLAFWSWSCGSLETNSGFVLFLSFGRDFSSIVKQFFGPCEASGSWLIFCCLYMEVCCDEIDFLEPVLWVLWSDARDSSAMASIGHCGVLFQPCEGFLLAIYGGLLHWNRVFWSCFFYWQRIWWCAAMQSPAWGFCGGFERIQRIVLSFFFSSVEGNVIEPREALGVVLLARFCSVYCGFLQWNRSFGVWTMQGVVLSFFLR